MTVRPTLPCLREDLGIAPPPVDDPLDEIDHPLIRKANDQFAAPAGPRERIRVRVLRDTVRRLVCASLLDGHEHADEVAGAELGVLVQGSERGTCTALRITGSAPDNMVAVVLSLVPGCDRDGWYLEFAMPNRALRPGEQAYSNLMDPLRRRGSLKGTKPVGPASGSALVQQKPREQREVVFAEQPVGRLATTDPAAARNAKPAHVSGPGRVVRADRALPFGGLTPVGFLPVVSCRTPGSGRRPGAGSA